MEGCAERFDPILSTIRGRNCRAMGWRRVIVFTICIIMSKDPFANAIPDEPPPAYSAQGTTIASGPARPDFSGPPPVNEPLEANITGVGIGYGRRTDAGPSRPPPPSSPRPPTLPSRPDPHPTTVPTPGRPLLHRNQLLVYPKDYWCQKCKLCTAALI